jgi:hypothetical protein
MILPVHDKPSLGGNAMKPTQRSIAWLMAVVAMIAIYTSSVRALHAYNADLAQGLALTGLALQIGVFRSIRSRGRVRSFWVGFVASASATMLTFAWGIACPDSALSQMLIFYTKYANRYVNYVTHVWDFYNRTQVYPVLVVALAVIWSVPQLFLALVVGLLARAFSSRRQIVAAGETQPKTIALGLNCHTRPLESKATGYPA